jgi:hypothetical protein
MIDIKFYELGKQAYVDDKPAAPWSNQQVQDACAQFPSWSVEDKKAREQIMKSFSAGYAAAGDEAWAAISAE